MYTTRWMLRLGLALCVGFGLANEAFAEERAPEVVGLSMEDATTLLDKAGYKAKVSFDATGPVGRVLRQQPLGFAIAGKGTEVVIVVGGQDPAASTSTQPDRASGSPDASGGLEHDPFDLPMGEPEVPQPGAPTVPVTPPPAEGNTAEGDTAEESLAPARTSGLGLPPGFEEAPAARRTARRDLLPTPPAREEGGQAGDILPGSRPENALPSAPAQPAPSAPRATGPAPYGTIAPANLPRFEGPRLPATIGRSEEAARSMLGGWTVAVESAYSVPSLAGTVLNQWPAPGRKLAEGELVHIVIAIAEPPAAHYISISPVINLTPAEAVRVLRSEELVVELYTVPSEDSMFGRVVRQSPMAGSVLPRRSNVRVYVGRGSSESAVPAPPPMIIETGREAPAVGAPGSAFDPTLRAGQVVGRRDLGPSGEGAWESDRPVPPTLSPIELRPGDTPPLPPRETTPDPLGGAPLSVPSAPRTPTPQAPQTPERTGPTTRPARAPAQPTSADVGIPVLQAPAAGESYPKEFGSTFEWTAVRGATEYAWEVQMELPTGAWRNVTRKSATSPNLRPGAMSKGRYRWRVRAIAGSKVGGWSEWFRLYLY